MYGYTKRTVEPEVRHWLAGRVVGRCEGCGDFIWGAEDFRRVAERDDEGNEVATVYCSTCVITADDTLRRIRQANGWPT